jgi:hypothetical protein
VSVVIVLLTLLLLWLMGRVERMVGGAAQETVESARSGVVRA